MKTRQIAIEKEEDCRLCKVKATKSCCNSKTIALDKVNISSAKLQKLTSTTTQNKHMAKYEKLTELLP